MLGSATMTQGRLAAIASGVLLDREKPAPACAQVVIPKQ
jgi:hypothetical protein